MGGSVTTITATPHIAGSVFSPAEEQDRLRDAAVQLAYLNFVSAIGAGQYRHAATLAQVYRDVFFGREA